MAYIVVVLYTNDYHIGSWQLGQVRRILTQIWHFRFPSNLCQNPANLANLAILILRYVLNVWWRRLIWPMITVNSNCPKMTKNWTKIDPKLPGWPFRQRKLGKMGCHVSNLGNWGNYIINQNVFTFFVLLDWYYVYKKVRLLCFYNICNVLIMVHGMLIFWIYKTFFDLIILFQHEYDYV